MPYTVADVDTHIKNLSPRAKRQWVAIANAALKSCLSDGGKEADCAGQAIRKASGVAGKMRESATLEEAATLKSQAQQLLRQLKAILGRKDVAPEIHTRIQATYDALSKRWADLAPTDGAATATESASTDDPAALLEAAGDLLGMADSFDAIRGLVQSALRKRAMLDKLNDPGDADAMYDCPSCWIRDLFADSVVYSDDETLYRCDYTIAADDTVTLGDPTEVEVAYVPVGESVAAANESAVADPPGDPETEDPETDDQKPAEEAGRVELTSDLVPLVERAIRRDGTVPIKLIQPGQGSSGFYSADVLKRDGPRVFTKGLHMYADHMTAAEESERPEGSIKNLMAVLETGARWEDQGPDGPGLYADARVMPHFADHLEALAPHIGVSIRALGTYEEGSTAVKELVAAKSCDFVTRAGAGGKVLEMFESARGAAPIVAAPVEGADTAPLERSHNGMEELQENKGLDAQEARALREAFDGQARAIQEKDNRIKQLEEAVLMRLVKDFVDAELAEHTMPDMTRKRLAESLAQRPKLKDDQSIDVEAFRAHIRESVTAELRYLAEATGLGSGKIVGLGVSSLEEADGQRAIESIERSFLNMGMSPEQAKIAARGRG